MEQLFLEFGLKEGLFAGMFIWLFLHHMKTSSAREDKQAKTSEAREDKLFAFLDEMKVEFAKLVGSYEAISKDVSEIKQELHNKQDKQ